MDTTSTTIWWTCEACGVDAELGDGLAGVGTAVPCPDCAADMAPRLGWPVAA